MIIKDPKNYKEGLNSLLTWMNPQLSYMEDKTIYDNIVSYLQHYTIYTQRPMPIRMKKMIQYMDHIMFETKEKGDKQILIDYCYNLLLFTEGLMLIR